MCHIATPSIKKHYPRGHEIYKFGKPFLGHHTYTLSLFDLCLKVEKTIVKELMHYNYMSFMTEPNKMTSVPGVMEFHNVVEPFLVLITLHLVCLKHAPG